MVLKEAIVNTSRMVFLNLKWEKQLKKIPTKIKLHIL